MRTVGMENYRKRTLVRLRNAYLLLAVLIAIAGFVLPGRPLQDALVGIVSAGLIMGISALTLNQMVKTETLGLGWLVIDYLLKIGVVTGAILFTKYVLGDDPLLVAVSVIAAAAFTALVPILAVQVNAKEEEI